MTHFDWVYLLVTLFEMSTYFINIKGKIQSTSSENSTAQTVERIASLHGRVIEKEDDNCSAWLNLPWCKTK